MAKRIVVVGSINLDLVASTQRIPIAGETVAGVSFRTFPGGKGANQAVAAARLGASVTMLGKVGSDTFGGQLKESLRESNVNTDAIEVVPGSSGVALITTDAKGGNAITVVAGANGHVSPEDLEANTALIRGAGILLTQLEIPLETVECLAAIAIRERIPLVLDPAPARPLPPSLLKNVDWLTPNETETCVLMGTGPGELPEESIMDAADALLKGGSRNVILKLGDRGCYVALQDGTRRRLPRLQGERCGYHCCGRCFQWSSSRSAGERARTNRQRLMGVRSGCDLRYSPWCSAIDANPYRSATFPRT
jgi:ribokinase